MYQFRSRRGRWVLAAVAGLLAAAALLIARQWRAPRFAYSAAPLSTAAYHALAAKRGWRARSLRVEDGVALRGIERAPAESGQPAVLLFEGNSAHLLEDGQRFLDRLLNGRSWGAAVFAYRGFDGSDGVPTPEALESDAWKVYSALQREWRLPARRIHLVGFSLGTSVVAAVAARAARAPPGSVTLLAATTELDMIPATGGAKQRFETLKFLGAIAGPVLVVHGGSDRTLPVAQGRAIAERLGERARYIEEPELGHYDLHESQAAIEEVRAFIDARARRGG